MLYLYERVSSFCSSNKKNIGKNKKPKHKKYVTVRHCVISEAGEKCHFLSRVRPLFLYRHHGSHARSRVSLPLIVHISIKTTLNLIYSHDLTN